MNILRERALEFVLEILNDPQTPTNIKQGINQRLGTTGPRAQALETRIAIVRNPGRPNNERLQALGEIIEFVKGEAES
jgi:hypothetical protein